jgi:hypothetical protein
MTLQVFHAIRYLLACPLAFPWVIDAITGSILGTIAAISLA